MQPPDFFGTVQATVPPAQSGTDTRRGLPAPLLPDSPWQFDFGGQRGARAYCARGGQWRFLPRSALPRCVSKPPPVRVH